MEHPSGLHLPAIIPMLDRLTSSVLGPMMPDSPSVILLEHFPSAAFVAAIEAGESAPGSLADNALLSRSMANELMVAHAFLSAVIEFQTVLSGLREMALRETFPADALEALRLQAREIINAPEQHMDFIQEFILYLMTELISLQTIVSTQTFHSVGLDARQIVWDDFRTSSRDQVEREVKRALGRKVTTRSLTKAQYPLHSWALGLLRAPDCKGENVSTEELLRSAAAKKAKRKVS